MNRSVTARQHLCLVPDIRPEGAEGLTTAEIANSAAGQQLGGVACGAEVQHETPANVIPLYDYTPKVNPTTSIEDCSALTIELALELEAKRRRDRFFVIYGGLRR